VVPIAPHLVHSGIGAPAEAQSTRTQASAAAAPQLTSLAENEARYIRQVLEHTGWAVAGRGGAAEILGLPASTLRSRMKKLGIERADSR
jgi:transcriptional regulator with GAF, ATPase, and Fis domain